MRRIAFLLPLALIPTMLFAQFTYTLDQSVPVAGEAGDLSLPWAGGLNSVQYNTMDLNGDHTDDLVLFDRMANQIITFLWQENRYQYAPEYAGLFPESLTNFVMLRDYNCDERKDIFTGDLLGIRVFKNTTPEGANLSWEQQFFGPSKSAVIQTKGFTTKINLQIQYDDLPAIADADGDGDLDVFSMRFVGNGTVEYHRNFSKERYNTCDSLDFERATQAWGNFRECGCAQFAFNGTDCAPSSGGRTRHAGGKALLALDVNGDQQQDLVFSESDCSQLYLLQNEGTIESPLINTYTTFPPIDPVNLILFPAAYYEDVDHDGKKDLLASPNIYTKESLMINLWQSSWLYRNTGTSSAPSFTFEKRDFLQDQMIDLGDNSKPAFADYDADGDYDMFISQNSTNEFTSSVVLFENTGTPSSPAFTFKTDDYLNFQFGNFYNMKIQFIDINGDNAIDLLFTATSFDTGATGLYAVMNKSTGTFDFSGQFATRLNFNLNSLENIYLTNVDNDGLPDILVGRGNGNVEFWKNTGTTDSPAFTKEQDDFLGLTSLNVQNIACTAADLDADGKTDLVVGDETGLLKIVSDYKSGNQSMISEIVFNTLTSDYQQLNLGGRIWPTTVNLFNSNKPAIVLGNLLGGLHLLKHDEGQSLPPHPVVDVYPNPFDRNDFSSHHNRLSIRTDRAVHLQVLSILGQKLSDPFMIGDNDVHSYEVPPLPAGVYILKFTANKKSTVRRLVIL